MEKTEVSKALKGIVIGLGPHGQRIVQAIQMVSGIKLFGLIDLSEEILNSIKVSPDVIKSTDLDAFLKHEKVDVACVATNGPSHAEIAIKCMDFGVGYIMIEKPFACSIAECKAILESAKRNNARLIVDHPRRVSKNYGLVKMMIDNGQLGEIRNIYIQRPGIGLGCLATHSFDLASFFVGRPVKAVTGWVDEPKRKNPRGGIFVDPGGTVVLDYGDGIKGLVSQIEDGAGPIFIEINLTSGRVHIDEKTDRLEIIKRDLSVKKMPGTPAAYEQIINPGGLGGKRILVDEIKWLLEDLISTDQPKAKARYGYDSIETLVAAYVSHENSHIPIKLPLAKEYHSKWLPIT